MLDALTVDALIGGSLIGLAAALLFIGIGRIAGISGISAAIFKRSVDQRWALVFLTGLMVSGVLTGWLLDKQSLRELSGVNVPALLVGGLLVGIGTRLGSGCTSGHGVCGLARRSPRSLVATLTFLSVGMVVATALGYVGQQL